MNKQTFVIEQKLLLSIISSMQPICTKRTALDATSQLLFQVGHRELVIKSTDLEISLQSSYRLKEAHITDAHSFLVSGRRLFELLKELDGDVTCTIEDTQLLLQSGKVHLLLNTRDAQDFPPFPERIENLMQLETKLFLELLNKVAFLIPQNNANHALNGLFIEISPQELKMTATDGHCLVQVKTPHCSLESSKQWLMPRRAVFELKKILEASSDTTVFLGLCGNQLVLSGESFNFFTKLLSDQFPNYVSILDRKEFTPAYVDRSQFMKTLRRSSCLLSGQFIATNFSFLQNQIKVVMQNKEVGTLQEEIPLYGFQGAHLDIRFYAPYLLSGLQVFPHEQIQFYLKNCSRPIIFETIEAAYNLLYLVMPVAPTHAE